MPVNWKEREEFIERLAEELTSEDLGYLLTLLKIDTEEYNYLMAKHAER